MRETGPMRVRFGGSLDDAAAAEAVKPYLGIARTQLGITKNLMRLGGLQQGARTVTLADGTVIKSQSLFGQDMVTITPVLLPVQPVAQPAAPLVAAAEDAPAIVEQEEFASDWGGAWDANNKSAFIILSGGDLIATDDGLDGTTQHFIQGTVSHSESGVWYLEYTVLTDLFGCGIARGTGAPYGGDSYQYTNNSRYNAFIGGFSNSFGPVLPNYFAGDVIGMKFDAGEGALTFFLNGVSLGIAISGLSGAWFPLAWLINDPLGSVAIDTAPRPRLTV